MTLPTSSQSAAPGVAFYTTRTVNAPRDVVWKLYTEMEPLMQWFGPKGFTLPHSTMDLRAGGHFHYCMRAPNGFEMWGKWTFVEITPPETLTVIVAFSDAQGGLTRHPLSAQWPLQTLSTTTLRAVGERTEIIIQWEPYQATAEETTAFVAGHASMAQGCAGTFDQLEAYLESRATAAPD